MSWKRLANKELQERLKMRARIVQLIREFFIKEGFLEVETPILVSAAGQEPHLEPMRVEFTDDRAGKRQGYLITSPEYAHKKLLAAGFEKTFEITRAFRAGEHWGGLHNPEFTMLEWYRANADYQVIMNDVEKMVQHAAGSRTVEYQGRVIDLSSTWERLSVAKAFQKYANTNLEEVSGEEAFFKIFLTRIEPKLGFPKPTILYDYPASMASLARLKPSPGLRPPSPRGRGNVHDLPLPTGEGGGEGAAAERFEVYIAGMELGNAFSELNDAKEQRARFMEEQALRKKLGKEIIPLDEDFLDAVGQMPPSAGIAFGVDRLAMFLTNAKTIEEVLAFPASALWLAQNNTAV